MEHNKSFLEIHKDGLEVMGFWTEEYKQSIIKRLESFYATFVIREFGINDMVINGDKILLKWYKRFEPLTDEELEEQYGRVTPPPTDLTDQKG